MTAEEIKQAINEGRRVYWKCQVYEVIKDKNNQFLISYRQGQHYIGLTWQDGQTLNGEPDDFYIEATEQEMRDTYKKAFGREYDSEDRKQFPLPINLAYCVALHKLSVNQ